MRSHSSIWYKLKWLFKLLNWALVEKKSCHHLWITQHHNVLCVQHQRAPGNATGQAARGCPHSPAEVRSPVPSAQDPLSRGHLQSLLGFPSWATLFSKADASSLPHCRAWLTAVPCLAQSVAHNRCYRLSCVPPGSYAEGLTSIPFDGVWRWGL